MPAFCHCPLVKLHFSQPGSDLPLQGAASAWVLAAEERAGREPKLESVTATGWEMLLVEGLPGQRVLEPSAKLQPFGAGQAKIVLDRYTPWTGDVSTRIRPVAVLLQSSSGLVYRLRHLRGAWSASPGVVDTRGPRAGLAPLLRASGSPRIISSSLSSMVSRHHTRSPSLSAVYGGQGPSVPRTLTTASSETRWELRGTARSLPLGAGGGHGLCSQHLGDEERCGALGPLSQLRKSQEEYGVYRRRFLTAQALSPSNCSHWEEEFFDGEDRCSPVRPVTPSGGHVRRSPLSKALASATEFSVNPVPRPDFTVLPECSRSSWLLTS
ncbi:hypothetical protein CB1_000932047 [Camelus ferus]|nr:hypothetical protein CB1_000932047 [Camelus ferus]